MKKRRDFLKTVAMGSAGLALGKTVLGGAATKFGAKSYKNIIGANDRIHVALIGLDVEIAWLELLLNRKIQKYLVFVM